MLHVFLAPICSTRSAFHRLLEVLFSEACIRAIKELDAMDVLFFAALTLWPGPQMTLFSMPGVTLKEDRCVTFLLGGASFRHI